MRDTNDDYEVYAEVYDDFKGDRAENINLLKSLIKKHCPHASTLLELACGTGSIAQGLARSFTVVGLDNSAPMLKIARQKLPSTFLLHADMADFAINQKFDVIYCVHNSVNHLLAFREWEAMFSRVEAHLNRDGIFIFDINPIEKMDGLAAMGLGVTQVGENYVITQVTKDAKKTELYHWDVKIFKKQRRGKFSLDHAAIKVSTYPAKQVKEALAKNFDIANFFIPEQAEKFDDVGRAYYVCAKR